MKKSKVEISNGIICVEVSGAFNLVDSKIIFQDVLDQARKQGMNRIVIDICKLEGEITTTERFEFGEFLSKLRASGIKIAFVANPIRVWPPPFLENVAVNGSAKEKVTTDKKKSSEMAKWLNSVFYTYFSSYNFLPNTWNTRLIIPYTRSCTANGCIITS